MMTMGVMKASSSAAVLEEKIFVLLALPSYSRLLNANYASLADHEKLILHLA